MRLTSWVFIEDKRYLITTTRSAILPVDMDLSRVASRCMSRYFFLSKELEWVQVTL